MYSGIQDLFDQVFLELCFLQLLTTNTPKDANSNNKQIKIVLSRKQSLQRVTLGHSEVKAIKAISNGKYQF